MKKIHLIAFVFISTLVLSGCSIPGMGDNTEKETVSTTIPNAQETTTPPVTPPKQDTKTAEVDTSVKTPNEAPGDSTVPSDTPKAIVEGGIYLPYTSTAIAQAKGNIVLFFHANWCPTCIKVNKDIEANLNKIPKDLTILKVNFDDATDLRETYGVTEQHTFVQVDNSGKLIKKWR